MKEKIYFFVELHTIVTEKAVIYEGITAVPDFGSHWVSSPKALLLSKPSKKALQSNQPIIFQTFLMKEWDYVVN